MVNDRPVRTPEYGTPEKQMEAGIRGAYHLVNWLNEMTVPFRLSPERMIPFDMGLTVPVLYPTYDAAYMAEYTKFRPELQKLENEFFWNAITGKVDIDAEWGSYISKWMSIGGKELNDAVNAEWQAFKKGM